MNERNYFEDVGVDERVILKGISRSEMRSIDWIDLAQQREGWRALVNALMNYTLITNLMY